MSCRRLSTSGGGASLSFFSESASWMIQRHHDNGGRENTNPDEDNERSTMNDRLNDGLILLGRGASFLRVSSSDEEERQHGGDECRKEAAKWVFNHVVCW
jgi:hypothetical protein